MTPSRSRSAREAQRSGVAATEDGLDHVRRESRYAVQRIGSNLNELRPDAAVAIERVLLSVQITNELSDICQYVPPNLTESGDAQLARNTIAGFIGMGQVAMIERHQRHQRDEPAPGYRCAFSDAHD